MLNTFQRVERLNLCNKRLVFEFFFSERFYKFLADYLYRTPIDSFFSVNYSGIECVLL